MNIQQLKYFICISEHLSFSRAAKQLYISQSTLSYNISQLENELGLKLFVRDGNKIALTKAGKIMYREALDVVKRFDNISRVMESLKEQERYKLRIGFLDLLLPYFFDDLISPFMHYYPEIHVSVERDSYYSMHHQLVASDYFDVIFTRDFIMDFNEFDYHDIKTMTVQEDDLAIIVPKDYPADFPDGLFDLSRFNDETFILLDSKVCGNAWNYINSICKEHGLNVKNRTFVQYADIMLMQIADGQGITVFFSCDKRFEKDYHIKSFKVHTPDPAASICVAWNRQNKNPALKLFLDYVKDYIPVTNA